MARGLFWIVAVTALFSVSQARYEDCETPPEVQHASVAIEDDEDTVRAIYTCNSGYELQGTTQLICDLDTDVWSTDPPICIAAEETSNEVEPNARLERQRKKKLNDVPEDRTVTSQLAATLDMSCVAAKVKAPEIRHGYVQKYDRRRKGDKVFLVALYGCNDNFEFEDTEISALYCSEQKWVGELPTCMPLGEYTEEEEEEEEYDEYEAVDEAGEGENGDADADEDEQAVGGTRVAPPPPPPPTQPAAAAPPLDTDNELSNEITAELAPAPAPAPTDQLTPAAAVTDASIVVAPTHDPYTPRLLDDNCGPDRGGCEHKCERLLFPGENEARLKCACFEGFSLDPYDYASCHDIDECELNNGGCEQICNNLPGSFQCACEQGLQVDTLTGNTCIDINECLLRNGHGPCQDTCHNLRPGYSCSCEQLPGARLSADRHSCEDAGECANNNGGCSHICLPSLGRVYCLCPAGFRMSDDGKNCLDVNECDLPEVAAECAAGCENTPGSYRCVPALNSREEAVEAHVDEQDTSDGDDEDEGDAGTVRTAEEAVATTCSSGFTLAADGSRCVDIDECREGTSGCEHCVNTEGSFECSCPGGYDLADDERSCIDINECEIVVEDEADDGVPYKICAHGCVNTPGSFVCICADNEHLQADRRNCAPDTCQDLNNPQLNKTRCAHQCVDLPSGVYECVCPAGYRLSNDLHSCEVAENACAKAGGYERCAPGTCLSSEDDSSFSCACPTGYSDEVYSCQDVDECATGTHACSHECLNTAGGYQCGCPGGFRFVQGSEQQCEDIDECQSKPDLCGSLTCVNLPGAFTCLCADGAEPNAETGLCAIVDPCEGSSCSHMCITEEAGFRCICPEGMQLAADNANCVYPNHCAADNNGCAHICQPEQGGACGCYDGYALAADGKSCEDVDECQMNNGGCHQLCRNEPGGYSCACAQGFEFLDGALKDFCFDVDECAADARRCGEGLVCENLNGSFTCLCPTGYALGLPAVHAALHSLRSLLSSAPLSFIPSSPIPAAPPSMLACLDIDECSMANGNCSHFCLNFPGSFQCACPPGYALSALDNATCLLVDGCAQMNGGCSHACDFTEGSVVCSCPVGFALDEAGRSCQDIDECALGRGRCAHNCFNTPGSFACACRAGFELAADARDCLDIDECANGYGNCTFICINLIGSYACACEAGSELSADRRTCVDIDECARGRHDCSHECLNVHSGYECLCPSGYRLGADKANCEDVDECAGVAHGCSHTCSNTPGSYTCTCPTSDVLDVDGRSCKPANPCPSGSELSEDGSRCVLVDECQRNNGGCSHTCSQQLGCSCPTGLTLGVNGKSCEDIDECSMNNGDCSHTCKNTYGGYECACPPGDSLMDGKRCAAACPRGFVSSATDASQCVDVDECGSTPGLCQYKCVNTNGGYECVCPHGYRLRNGRECEDIDECQHDNGGCVGGECINQNGSYECKCPLGRRLAADRRTCERRTDLRDQCAPFVAPENGEIHCTKYRHKQKLFYNTKCKVWCNQGYRLHGPAQRFCNSSGLWDNFDSQCLPIICPPIPPPSNGVILPSSCSLGKIFLGERCRLQCHPGHVPVGKSTAVCTSAQQWSNNGSFTCVSAGLRTPLGVGETVHTVVIPTASTGMFRPTLSSIPAASQPRRPPQTRPQFGLGASVGIQRPYIKCPRNATVFLANGERTAHIVLQKPLTNLDFRYIESFPAWTKGLQAHLAVGTYVITFRGQDPVSGRRARCQTMISVRRAEPPRVSFCTPSFEVNLSAGQAYRSVAWEEPRFETNTGGLKKLYKSRLPGELFGIGLHTIYYEGTNEEGLTSRCEFKIHVKTAAQQSAPMIGLRLPNAAGSFASPVMHPSLTNAKLLAGHESYVICPGRSPMKVTQSQTVNLPPGCFLKNVRVNPLRQYAQRRFISPRWTPFSSF